MKIKFMVEITVDMTELVDGLRDLGYAKDEPLADIISSDYCPIFDMHILDGIKNVERVKLPDDNGDCYLPVSVYTNPEWKQHEDEPEDFWG